MHLSKGELSNRSLCTIVVSRWLIIGSFLKLLLLLWFIYIFLFCPFVLTSIVFFICATFIVSTNAGFLLSMVQHDFYILILLVIRLSVSERLILPDNTQELLPGGTLFLKNNSHLQIVWCDIPLPEVFILISHLYSFNVSLRVNSPRNSLICFLLRDFNFPFSLLLIIER